MHLLKTKVIIIILSSVFCLSHTAYAQQNAREEELLIQGLIRDELFEVAADNVLEYALRYPASSKTPTLIATITRILNREELYGKSIPLLKYFLQEYPSSRSVKEVRVYLGNALYRTGNYIEAQDILLSVIKDGGQQKSVRLDAKEYLANIYYQQSKYEAARSLLEETNPKGLGPNMQLILAKACFGLGQYDKAHSLLERLLSRRRKDDVWFAAQAELSKLLVHEKQFAECVELLKDFPSDSLVAEQAAYETVLRTMKGVSLHNIGDYKEAYKILEPFWKESDLQNNTSPPLPAILLSLNEWHGASQMLEGEIEQTENTALKISLSEYLLECYRHIGNSAKVSEYSLILASYVSGEKKIDYYLSAASHEKDLDVRRKILNEALDFSVGDYEKSQVNFELANSSLGSGKFEDAISYFEQILDLSNTGKYENKACRKLAIINFNNGNFDSAFRYCERAQRSAVNPEQLVASLELQVKTLFAQQKYDSIKPLAQKLLVLDHSVAVDPEIWEKAAFAASIIHEDELVFRLMLHRSSEEKYSLLKLNYRSLKSNKELELTREEIELLQFLANNSNSPSDERHKAQLLLSAWFIKNEKYERAIEFLENYESDSEDSWEKDWAKLKMSDCLSYTSDVTTRRNKLIQLVENCKYSDLEKLALERLQGMLLANNNYAAALQYNEEFNKLSPTAQIGKIQFLRSARRAYYGGNYGRSVEIYDSIYHDGLMTEDDIFIYIQSLALLKCYQKAYEIVQTINDSAFNNGQREVIQRIRAVGAYSGKNTKQALGLFKNILVTEEDVKSNVDLLRYAIRAAIDEADEISASNWIEHFLNEQLTSEDIGFLEEIAEYFVSIDRIDESRKVLKRTELFAEDVDERLSIKFKLAELTRAERGNVPAAEEYLNIAYLFASEREWTARARLAAAELYEEAGQYSYAERQYQRVATANPGTELATRAAAKLRELVRKKDQLREEQLRSPNQ